LIRISSSASFSKRDKTGKFAGGASFVCKRKLGSAQR
jgi:hypothetical protein